jgi:CRP-like cAMP-binding protein
VALDLVVSLLQVHPFLGAVPPEGLRIVAFTSERRRFRAGSTLFAEGAMSDGAFLVISGRVELATRADPAPVLASPGALVGELALVVDIERPATAVAIEDVEALVILRAVFLRVLGEYPAAAEAIRDLVAGRLATLNAGLAEVGEALTHGLSPRADAPV